MEQAEKRTLVYEEKGVVGILTISRPEALNALNKKLLEELAETFAKIDAERIRCLILTGEGKKVFAAGADIREMYELSQKEAEEFGKMGNLIFRKIETFPLPVIAAVNGYALGGGCELAMSCDIRICSEEAVFGQPEVGLGIIPGFGGTQRLPRLVGMSAAKELLYTGRSIDAREALRIGLVSQVYPAEELMEKAVRLAKQISGNAPIAVKNCKQAVFRGIEKQMVMAADIEAGLFGACFASLDQKEGMRAFLEKRKNRIFLNK